MIDKHTYIKSDFLTSMRFISKEQSCILKMLLLSALGFVAIIGSIVAGLLTEKMNPRKLSIVVVALGALLISAGNMLLLPTKAITKYVVNIIAFCGMQSASCVFSIFALSMIQQRTPNHLTGKVMAYVSDISMCAQPLGQMVYGILFDGFSNAVFLVLLPTGILVCIIGVLAANFFIVNA